MHKVNLAPMSSDVYTHKYTHIHILVSVDILSCRIISSFVLPFQHHDKTVSALHTLHLHQGETRLLVTSDRWGRGHDRPNPYGSCSTFSPQIMEMEQYLIGKKERIDFGGIYFFHQFSIYCFSSWLVFFLFILGSSGWSLDLKNHQNVKP